MKDNLALGIRYGLLSAFSLALMSFFVRLIGHHVPTGMILFFRFFFSFLILLPFCYLDSKFSFRIHKSYLFFMRAIFGALAMLGFFLCIRSMPLANAILLLNSAPIYVPMIVFFTVGIKTTKMAWLGVFISLFGLIIILDPVGNAFFHFALLYGLMAGVGSAIATVILRFLSRHYHYSASTILFYYLLFCTLACGVFLPFVWTAITLHELLLLGAVGIFGFLFQWFLAKSLQYTKIRLISPLLLSSVVFGALFAWLYWGEMLTWQMWVGTLTLTIGLIMVIRFVHVAHV